MTTIQDIIKSTGKIVHKLNQQLVDQIRAASDKPTTELAEQYDVSVTTIKDIRRGNTWRPAGSEPLPAKNNPMPTDDDYSEFLAKLPQCVLLQPSVFLDTDCWIWQLSTQHGYPAVSFMGRGYRVNRLVCIATHGPPETDDLDARHLCGEPKCVRPTHLQFGTKRENAEDRWLHGTMTYGETHPAAKLSDNDVREIIRLYETGNYTLQELGSKFNVSSSNIFAIKSGRSRVTATEPVNAITTNMET